MMNLDKRLFEGIRIIKKYRISFIMIVVIMVILFILTIIQMDRYWERKTLNYIKVETNDELYGVINDVFDSQGISYITINDSSKYWFIHARNYQYRPSWLDAFIRKGDSIMKRSGTDTLLIYREEIEYYFILGKYINEIGNKRIIRRK